MIFFLLFQYAHKKLAKDTWQSNRFFKPSTKVIQFSKYLRFHLDVVLPHANWAHQINAHTSVEGGLLVQKPFEVWTDAPN